MTSVLLFSFFFTAVPLPILIATVSRIETRHAAQRQHANCNRLRREVEIAERSVELLSARCKKLEKTAAKLKWRNQYWLQFDQAQQMREVA